MYKLPEQSIKESYIYTAYCAYRHPQCIRESFTIERDEITDHEYINTDQILKVKLSEQDKRFGDYEVEGLKKYTLLIKLIGGDSYFYIDYSVTGIPEKFLKIISDLTRDYDSIEEEKLPQFTIVHPDTLGDKYD
jgi:hypothetical protein